MHREPTKLYVLRLKSTPWPSTHYFSHTMSTTSKAQQGIVAAVMFTSKSTLHVAAKIFNSRHGFLDVWLLTLPLSQAWRKCWVGKVRPFPHTTKPLL